MIIELSKLDYSELKKLEKELASEFKKRESTLFRDAREELRQVERKHGLTIEQILYGKKTEAAPSENQEVEYKYRNPENPKQVWTGRGKKPAWFIQAIEAGKTEASLQI